MGFGCALCSLPRPHWRRPARRAAPSPRLRSPGLLPIQNPFAALLGQSGAPAAALKPEQRALVDKVNRYLSSVQSLQGKFVQVGGDGRRTTGDFYLAKPGRVRFEYDDPSPIELVADGTSVVVRDRNLATQDVYPLSQTPLRFLLADRVDLTRDTNVIAAYADDMFVTVVLGRAEHIGRHQPADDYVRCQEHAAQAVDGDRSAGLRHDRCGL